MPKLGTIARAFEIAREGNCRNIDDVCHRLKAEGFDYASGHMNDRYIKEHLLKLLSAAKPLRDKVGEAVADG